VLQVGAVYLSYLKRLERQSFHLLTTNGRSLLISTMNLIGSEVDVVGEDASMLQRESRIADNQTTTTKDYATSPSATTMNELSSPFSPPRAAERIFLSDLTTQNISAFDLADQIQQSGSSSKSSQRSYRHRNETLSVVTDASTSDWVSAVGTEEDNLFNNVDATPKLNSISTRTSDTLQTPFSSPESSSDEESAYENFFKKDVLSRKIRDLSEVDEDTYLDSDMATPSSTMSSPGKFFPSEAPQHLDAAEKVYDTAKGIWAWGKGVVILKPFLGMTEAMAGKFVDVMGSDLASVDGILIGKIHEIDDSLLNPAIAAVIGALLGAAGKTEDVVKPLILSILKPLGLLKDTPENPEVTPVPGVTTVVQ
jgi:hypothetical protein